MFYRHTDAKYLHLPFDMGGDILHCNPLHDTVLISNASNTVPWISLPLRGFQYLTVDFNTVPWISIPCHGFQYRAAADFNTLQ